MPLNANARGNGGMHDTNPGGLPMMIPTNTWRAVAVTVCLLGLLTVGAAQAAQELKVSECTPGRHPEAVFKNNVLEIGGVAFIQRGNDLICRKGKKVLFHYEDFFGDLMAPPSLAEMTVAFDFPTKGLDSLYVFFWSGTQQGDFSLYTIASNGVLELFVVGDGSFSTKVPTYRDVGETTYAYAPGQPEGSIVANDYFYCYEPGKRTNTKGFKMTSSPDIRALEFPASADTIYFNRFLVFNKNKWQYDAPGQYPEAYRSFARDVMLEQYPSDASPDKEQRLRFEVRKGIQAAYYTLMAGHPEAEARALLEKQMTKPMKQYLNMIMADIKLAVKEQSNEVEEVTFHRFE